MSNSNRKVIRYKKPITLNIGAFVFSLLFIYIISCVILYFSHEQLALYEVIEKKISDNKICQGVILRDEHIVTSDKAGFINYYVAEGSRVAKNSIAYTVDQNGEVYKLLTSTETKDTLTTEETDKIRTSLATFQNEYQNSRYSSVYDFKYDIENTLLDLSNINMINNLDELLKDGSVSGSFDLVNSANSGIISYTMDGMEGLTKEKITETTMDNTTYKSTQLRSSEAKEAGSPIYKLITDENWSIVISLTKEQYAKVSEKDMIRITFLKDQLTTTAGITCYNQNNAYYATLSLNKYMIQYLSDRYVDIELSLNSAEGLKIPLSSITKKDFYKIPLSYFPVGKDGIVKVTYDKKGDIKPQYIPAEKYYEDEEFAYIDTNILEAGTLIQSTDTNETYEIKETKTLEGVYNVNKGYSVFRRIEKEYENSEYCIVKTETKYGISVYDHIVLNAALVKEQKIIY